MQQALLQIGLQQILQQALLFMLVQTQVLIGMAQPTSPTYSPQTQEALETMAARVLLSVGVILVQVRQD